MVRGANALRLWRTRRGKPARSIPLIGLFMGLIAALTWPRADVWGTVALVAIAVATDPAPWVVALVLRQRARRPRRAALRVVPRRDPGDD